MKVLLRDRRVQRLFLANTTGSIGSGITIFAVPWLLVNRPDGNAAFRDITILTTVVLFAFMPGYGAWIDRHSRKTALLGGEAFGFLATLAMAITGLALGGFAKWQLMTIYFCGMSYYTLHYPAKFAFIQQIIPREQYQSLMGLLEIQGQIAMMVAGGLGALLVDRVPLWAILFFDASTYLFSFCIQVGLPYEATHLAEAKRDAAQHGLWASLTEGGRWLRTQPVLAIFLSCSLMPFIVTMASNYLFPIYVAQTLQAKASTFGVGEIVFAVGAIVAGAFLPRLLARATAYSAVVLSMVGFLLGLILLITFRHPWLYFSAALLLGFGNAGARVARSTLMLHIVPQRVMGRVGIFYSVIDRLLRTALVGSMVVIDWGGPPAGFWLLFGITLLAFGGVLRSRRGIHLAEAHPLETTPVPA